VNPTAYYTDEKGESLEGTSIDDGQAPLSVTFRSNPSGMDEWTPTYEWHFRKLESDIGTRELLVRYEEDTQYTFNESGTFHIVQKTILNKGNEIAELDSVTLIVTISESRLEFPNAFSPNDDGINDIYGAIGVNEDNSTAHYKSIVEFHAYIFNRWGQKLFEWTDVSKGWDGKYNGKPVKEGVYFVLVKAKGADGRKYNIRKDVNLLRAKDGRSTTTTGE
jgi:gliding motility-associated-like protein